MERLEKNAIEILHMMCERSECIICDSGGKDSSVLKHIALQAKEKYGLQFRVRHNHTTVDAPETVYFVREEKRKFEQMGIPYEIHYPKESMWQLIVRHVTPPTRLMRYCCADLKENTGEFGERIVTGVRKAESNNRKNNQGAITIPKPKKDLLKEAEKDDNFLSTNKGGVIVMNLDNAETRRTVENCFRTHKVIINPLIDWDDEFLWWYIKKNAICLFINNITVEQYKKYAALMEKNGSDKITDALFFNKRIIQEIFGNRMSLDELGEVDVIEFLTASKGIHFIMQDIVSDALLNIVETEPIERETSAFDEYDRENGYEDEEQEEQNTWKICGEIVDRVTKIAIRLMRESYGQCMKENIIELLKYLKFELETVNENT